MNARQRREGGEARMAVIKRWGNEGTYNYYTRCWEESCTDSHNLVFLGDRKVEAGLLVTVAGPNRNAEVVNLVATM